LFQKHSLLPNWEEFCASYESAERSKKQEHRAKSDAAKALVQLKLLDTCTFFLAYPSFGSTVRSFNDKFAHYFDTDKESMQAAAERYFSLLFKDNPMNPSVKATLIDNPKAGIQVTFDIITI
jgi:hypothetical protein